MHFCALCLPIKALPCIPSCIAQLGTPSLIESNPGSLSSAQLNAMPSPICSSAPGGEGGTTLAAGSAAASAGGVPALLCRRCCSSATWFSLEELPRCAAIGDAIAAALDASCSRLVPGGGLAGRGSCAMLAPPRAGDLGGRPAAPGVGGLLPDKLGRSEKRGDPGVPLAVGVPALRWLRPDPGRVPSPRLGSLLRSLLPSRSSASLRLRPRGATTIGSSLPAGRGTQPGLSNAAAQAHAQKARHRSGQALGRRANAGPSKKRHGGWAAAGPTRAPRAAKPVLLLTAYLAAAPPRRAPGGPRRAAASAPPRATPARRL